MIQCVLPLKWKHLPNSKAAHLVVASRMHSHVVAVHVGLALPVHSAEMEQDPGALPV